MEMQDINVASLAPLPWCEDISSCLTASVNFLQDFKSNNNVFGCCRLDLRLSYFTVSAYLSEIRHLSFGSSVWDLGIFPKRSGSSDDRRAKAMN